MKYNVSLRELCVGPQLSAELDSVMLPVLYKLGVSSMLKSPVTSLLVCVQAQEHRYKNTADVEADDFWETKPRCHLKLT